MPVYTTGWIDIFTMKSAIFKKYPHIIYPAVFAAVIAVGGLIVYARSKGNVVINEVCTSNVSCCEDANGNFPDWMELYNPTAHDINISGYIINKTADMKKEKFVVPEGIVLSPGAFYLFDPMFNMSSEGCNINLLDDGKNYIDNVYVPKLKYDTTYARAEDGAGDWLIKQPTPGYSNADGAELDETLSGSVTASAAPGFYEEEFDLTLSSTSLGRKIYYTVDGSDPVSDGILYEGPIHITDRSSDENKWSMIPEMSTFYTEGRTPLPSYKIDKCTVIRAVAQDLLGRYTDISTYTYFVGYGAKSGYDNMTVVSVTANPYDLFDHDNGIMVLGSDYDEYVAAGEPEEYDKNKANFTRSKRQSERMASIEVFDENHTPVLGNDAGLRIKGLSSRWDVQKSFNVFFRKAYSDNNTETFETDGESFEVHSISLDKCGQDTETKMVDTIMQTCMSDTDCATVKRVPCCLFLNGEYWGFYWLSERMDAYHLSGMYGVAADDVIQIDKEEFEGGSAWDEGNFDRDSLLEYYAANIIVAHNDDWPDFNVRFWKTLTDEGTKYGDAKLRPVIFDMNSSSMEDARYDSFEYMLEWFYPFAKLTEEDENFRQDLADKIDEMSGKEFEREKVLLLIDGLYEKIAPQMVLDKMRFSDCDKEEAQRDFDDSVDALREFYKTRWEYLDTYKERYANGY